VLDPLNDLATGKSRAAGDSSKQADHV
jgi:hypothetical protein